MQRALCTQSISVEMVLNHNAANSAGVHFTQAFRMLVREL